MLHQIVQLHLLQNGDSNGDEGPAQQEGQGQPQTQQQQQAENVQVVQAAGSGDADEGLNTSNYDSCTAKRSRRQAEREDFQERLLAKLSDETEIAMSALIKK